MNTTINEPISWKRYEELLAWRKNTLIADTWEKVTNNVIADDGHIRLEAIQFADGVGPAHKTVVKTKTAGAFGVTVNVSRDIQELTGGKPSYVIWNEGWKDGAHVLRLWAWPILFDKQDDTIAHDTSEPMKQDEITAGTAKEGCETNGCSITAEEARAIFARDIEYLNRCATKGCSITAEEARAIFARDIEHLNRQIARITMRPEDNMPQFLDCREHVEVTPTIPGVA